ncbi:hypothetical protein ACVBEH_31290, partial [Roseateles sp. GG27B]
TVQERELFARLDTIDQQIDRLFKTAVELASLFKTEQVGKVITDKIDPLLNAELAELKSYIKLQKQQSAAATELTNARNS